jgi:secreted PhoX family phosphatase
VFLTPLTSPTPGSPAESRPFVEMGRFAHEAATVDSRTGIVYETEDAGSGRGSGFYRFVPRDPRDLARGGRLQILAVKGRPSADLRDGQRQGTPLPVEWITIEEPDPAGEAPNAVFQEGFAKGAAMFNRLEGCWEGAGSIFFASTSGGDAKNGDVNSDGFAEGYGQIWEYVPRGRSGGSLVLLYESPDGDVLDSPDNLVVSPRGGLVLCEDDASSADAGQSDVSEFFGEDKNRLIGLTLQGTAFAFAENARNDSEFAGACWSEDGQFLFVNVYGYDEEGTGGTLAITGPWEQGAL